MADHLPPSIDGDWSPCSTYGTGAWSLGPLWVDRGAGRLALSVGERHCNAYGAMHGGAMATFADAQLIAAMETTGKPEDHTPTVSLQVDYLSPVRAGDMLVATVSLLRRTRTLIFTQALLLVGDTVVARSSAIYRNTPGKDPT